MKKMGCMMLNELRVGSVVTHPLFDDPTAVRAIAFNGLYIGTEDGLPIHIDDFKPIEITDKVLELLKFVRMTNTAPGIGEFDWWETDDVSLTHIHKGLYGVGGLSGIKPMRYVHELQNSYFVITGKELNTKELLYL
jgi:hypothetical protein